MLTFIDTNRLGRENTASGEMTEVLNQHLCGAENVVGALRWLDSRRQFETEPLDKHQLIYVMDGKGQIRLNDQIYEVAKGAGVYLGPFETAVLKAKDHEQMKLFHLVVARVPE